LFRGSLVAPENRRANDLQIMVQTNQPVHLPLKLMPLTWLGRNCRLLNQGAQGNASGLPPVLGVLFGPAWSGQRQRQFSVIACDDLPLRDIITLLTPVVPISTPTK